MIPASNTRWSRSPSPPQMASTFPQSHFPSRMDSPPMSFSAPTGYSPAIPPSSMSTRLSQDPLFLPFKCSLPPIIGNRSMVRRVTSVLFLFLTSCKPPPAILPNSLLPPCPMRVMCYPVWSRNAVPPQHLVMICLWTTRLTCAMHRMTISGMPFFITF